MEENSTRKRGRGMKERAVLERAIIESSKNSKKTSLTKEK